MESSWKKNPPPSFPQITSRNFPSHKYSSIIYLISYILLNQECLVYLIGEVGYICDYFYLGGTEENAIYSYYYGLLLKNRVKCRIAKEKLNIYFVEMGASIRSDARMSRIDNLV